MWEAVYNVMQEVGKVCVCDKKCLFQRCSLRACQEHLQGLQRFCRLWHCEESPHRDVTDTHYVLGSSDFTSLALPLFILSFFLLPAHLWVETSLFGPQRGNGQLMLQFESKSPPTTPPPPKPSLTSPPSELPSLALRKSLQDRLPPTKPIAELCGIYGSHFQSSIKCTLLLDVFLWLCVSVFVQIN